MDNSTPMPPAPVPHRKGRFLIIAIVVVAALLIVVWAGRKVEQTAVLKNFPDYFTAGAQNPTNYTVTNPKDFQTRPVETLGQGSQFELNEPYTKALADYTKNMSANGWVAVGGSTQGSNYTTLKMAKNSEVIFVRLQPDSKDSNKTLVTIIPVEIKH